MQKNIDAERLKTIDNLNQEIADLNNNVVEIKKASECDKDLINKHEEEISNWSNRLRVSFNHFRKNYVIGINLNYLK